MSSRFLSLLLLTLCAPTAGGQNHPNVVFIAVDDLRPQLKCYGVENVHSPNIDRLADEGVLFERAYCMVPTCGASRASLMTSLRPAPDRFVNYLTRASNDAPGITTMNTHFKNNGYETVSLGKIFHHTDDNQAGWSMRAWRPGTDGQRYHTPENQRRHKDMSKKTQRPNRGPAWESAEAPEADYPDCMIAEKAVSELKRLKQQDQPFFLAVGFLKPHLPFVCPQKYWNLYDEAQFALPETYHRPQHAPDEAIHTSGELRAYADIPNKGPLSDEQAIKLIHGYHACVSFTDAQIGKVLDTLDDLELADRTIVVLWGDHGWNLGEHTLWCKHSCFETSMHIPLIVRSPGSVAGETSHALVETIDLYPTLSELAGLPIPEHVQGRSLVPLLTDTHAAWKDAAIGRYRDGDTIRTDNFRYTEYSNQGSQTARMLYNHRSDPEEDNNISEQSESQDAVKELSAALNRRKGR